MSHELQNPELETNTKKAAKDLEGCCRRLADEVRHAPLATIGIAVLAGALMPLSAIGRLAGAAVYLLSAIVRPFLILFLGAKALEWVAAKKKNGGT